MLVGGGGAGGGEVVCNEQCLCLCIQQMGVGG